MHSRSARPLCLVASAAVTLLSSVAFAGDPVAADALFHRGRELSESGAYALACPLFQESLRLDPAPGTLLNLADCEERIGQLASAWELFDRLTSEVPPSDERYALAVARATALARRVPRVTIRLPERAAFGIRVSRDDLELGGPSFGVALPVDPGTHVVLISAPGYEPRRVNVTAEPGETVELVAEPGPSKARGHVRAAGWATAATGAAALGLGAVFGGLALSERSASDAHCAGSVCTSVASLHAYDRARDDARVADVALGVGAVAVAAATLLIATSLRHSTSLSALQISPSGLGAAF